jgi:Fe-S-cluster containining protein
LGNRNISLWMSFWVKSAPSRASLEWAPDVVYNIVSRCLFQKAVSGEAEIIQIYDKTPSVCRCSPFTFRRDANRVLWSGNRAEDIYGWNIQSGFKTGCRTVSLRLKDALRRVAELLVWD